MFTTGQTVWYKKDGNVTDVSDFDNGGECGLVIETKQMQGYQVAIVRYGNGKTDTIINGD